MANALLVIDMQKDFIDGSLGTKEAKLIVPNVVSRIKKAIEHEEDIYFTLDTHYDDYLNTLEGKHLPVVHCIEGTSGWELDESIKPFKDKAKGIFKKNYFGYQNIAEELKGYDKITIIGLCTDICVVANAMLLKVGLDNTELYVEKNCCAGVTCDKHEAALKTMESCQINII